MFKYTNNKFNKFVLNPTGLVNGVTHFNLIKKDNSNNYFVQYISFIFDILQKNKAFYNYYQPFDISFKYNNRNFYLDKYFEYSGLDNLKEFPIFKVNASNELISISSNEVLDINVEYIYHSRLIPLINNLFIAYVAYKKLNQDKIYIMQFDNVLKNKKKRFIKASVDTTSFEDIFVINTLFFKGIFDKRTNTLVDYLNLTKKEYEELFFQLYNLNIIEKTTYITNLYSENELLRNYKFLPIKVYSYTQNYNGSDIDNINYEIINIISESLEAIIGL